MEDEDPQRLAEQGLRTKLAAIEDELAELVEKRRATEAAIEESKRRTNELLERNQEICRKEGELRGTIGSLKKALEAFDDVSP